MDRKKFYITTPIYYPSGNWHIGHCYTTVICDALARFHKMLGEDVFFLTGTDEHGQKIEKEAQKRGVTPMQFIDPLVLELKDMWRLLNISYDRFIRTTDEQHVRSVQKIYQKLYESGDIYKAEYSGYYCTPCESMWTEAQLVGGKCPDCGREVTLQKEESYFFRLSKYAPRILKLYEDEPEFLQPKSRINEMVNNFLKPGLQDLCVSRTTVKWGVPLPFDPNHYAYVWIDALSNYITALGYMSGDDSLYRKFWPADLHMVGKEIVRFHAIIWPAILMALGEPLPKRVYGHGWLLIGGDKLSKSKQEQARGQLTDPYELVKRYGTDAVRYFLLREIPFGSDGDYTGEKLLNRINADLANDLGNLVSRTTAMICQYYGGNLPPRGKTEGVDGELIALAEGAFKKVKRAMDGLNAPDALAEIFNVVSRANKYIDETTPWLLAKDESKQARLGAVLYNLAETVRICAVLLKPCLTESPKRILESLGCDAEAGFDTLTFGGLKEGVPIEKLPPVFPRIDVKKELDEVDRIVKSKKKTTEQKKQKAEEVQVSEITIDDFAKVQLKVGEVVACERVENSDKLLHETVKIGEEVRSIVSGIAKYYTPEEMVGKRVVVVTNLKPVKLRGVLSEGMILCAEDKDGNLALVSPEKEMQSGGSVR